MSGLSFAFASFISSFFQVDAVPTPQLLKWELNEAAMQAIEKAKKSLNASISNVDLTSLEYTPLTRDTLSKKWKVCLCTPLFTPVSSAPFP